MNKILAVAFAAALAITGNSLQAQHNHVGHDHTSDSQTKEQAASSQVLGQAFSPEGAVPANTVSKELAKTKRSEVPLKVEGTLLSVCQAKGCWAKIDAGDGQEMMVKFKDYAFFLPKDAAGKKIVMNGVAYEEETSVKELRHYAEDAGKSKKEIAKIKKPVKTIRFEADGVILKD